MGSRGSGKAGFVQEGVGLEPLDEGDSMRLGWNVNSEAIMLLLSVREKKQNHMLDHAVVPAETTLLPT